MINRLVFNLSVADLEVSVAFFKGLGFRLDPRFGGPTSACVVVGKNVHAILFTQTYLSTVHPTQPDGLTSCKNWVIAIDVETPEAVDTLVDRAISLGGRAIKKPVDYGWMYQHGFEDLDGYRWKLLFTDDDAPDGI